MDQKLQWYDLKADGFWWFLQPSSTYSKYIEALEQERIDIKREEDLEKTPSSFPAGY